MSKVRLNVLGLSYSETQAGAYALILAEENGERRLPIIIGGFEAQAIAIELEGLKPPRPLTHDLFLSMASVFKIDMIEINIYKLDEGVFHANLIVDNGSGKQIIDARTSDAVALALRFKCPIFTTEDIMKKAGIILNTEEEKPKKQTETAPKKAAAAKINPSSEFSGLTVKELEAILQEAIENEDYERASAIRDEIGKRKPK
jgi:uncharacterized protein